MKILKYLPTPGAPIDDEKAEIYGRELHRLASLNGGAGITPDMIVDEARKPGSPLKEWFQWDEGKAAGNWWKQQARMLCNSISVEVIMPDGGKHILPMMESIRVTILGDEGEDVGSERRYVTVRILEKEEIARRQVTEEATERLTAALQTIQDVMRLGGKRDSHLQKIINMLKTYLLRKGKAA